MTECWASLHCPQSLLRAGWGCFPIPEACEKARCRFQEKHKSPGAMGQWPETAMVMALYAIAKLIEARAVDRARNAIKSLLDLTPQDAEVQQADGQWRRMLTAAVAVGTIVRLRPGERISEI